MRDFPWRERAAGQPRREGAGTGQRIQAVAGLLIASEGLLTEGKLLQSALPGAAATAQRQGGVRRDGCSRQRGEGQARRWGRQLARGFQRRINGQRFNRPAKRRELHGQVFQRKGQLLAPEQGVATVHLQRNRQALAHALQLLILIHASATAGPYPVNAPLAHQLRQQGLRLTLEHQHVLPEGAELFPQVLQVLQRDTLALLANAAQIAPRPGLLPDVDQQELRGRRVGHESGVILQAQVVL